MKVKSFQDTDSFYIGFRADRVMQPCDRDENTLLAPGDEGRACALTMEYIRQPKDSFDLSYEQIAA
jgi:hypothetical protein